MQRPKIDSRILNIVGRVSRPNVEYLGSPDTRHLQGNDGVLAGLANLAGWFRHGHEHLQRQAREQGPVFRVRLGNHKFVCVTDPALGGEVLRNRDKCWSTALGWMVQFGGITDGPMDSPVTLDNGPHRDVRQLLMPAFSADAMRGYVDMAAPIFEDAVESWLAAGRVSFKPAVRELFARVSAKVFMGVDDPSEAARLDKAMSEFWAGSMALSKKEWMSPTWRRARRAYKLLFDHFYAQVDDRRRTDDPDLFSRLCRSNENVDWLDDGALVRMFLALMSAAFDTTSAGVASMGYLLAKHPEWQERLQTEALCTTIDRATYDDVKQLTQHELVWKETLRYYPVAPSVPRAALCDVDLGGYHIPSGTIVSVVISAAMRDPACWTSPDTFDPERFSAKRNEGKKSGGAYMPFGAGAHSCIGAQLAGLEAKAFWHAFGTRARFKLAEPYEARHEFRPLGMVSGDVDMIVEPLAVAPTARNVPADPEHAPSPAA
ncbi:MAG: cytochrome P450 [Myxococcota bacterium]